MKVQLVDINKLKPYDKNPRINDKAVAKVRASIEKFGFNQPIVANEGLTICVGHTRWMAAKEMKLKKVPVYVRKMDEQEFVAYNIADNRTGEESTWNEDLLAELLRELDGEDNEELMAAIGFSDEEMEGLLDEDDLDELVEDVSVVKGNTPPQGDVEKSHVKMVQLFFNEDNFKGFISMCKEIQDFHETENLTDTIEMVVLEHYNNEIGKD